MRPFRPLRRWAGWVGRRLRVVRRVSRGASVVPQALGAVLVIPRLSQQLDEVIRNTSSLPLLAIQLGHVARNTDHLARMVDHISALDESTSVLGQTHAELVVMQAAIVQMRTDTASMAQDVSRLVGLEQAVPALVPMLSDVQASVRGLHEVVQPLQGATTRVGRLSDRLPQRPAARLER